MEWLKTIGVAGFMFFLLKGLAWLLVFWLISRGIIRRRQLVMWKLKLRKALGLRRQKANVKENQGAANPLPPTPNTPTNP